ncbi:MAG: hypothetical protein SGILL_001173 [Bacillariaceae sp.]
MQESKKLNVLALIQAPYKSSSLPSNMNMKPPRTSTGVDKSSNSDHATSIPKWLFLLGFLSVGILSVQTSFGSFMKNDYTDSRSVAAVSQKITSGSHPRTNAHLCPPKTPPSMEKTNLGSQSGEDEILLQWFNGLCNGTYVEMGALNGIQFSNSLVFNREFDWSGLLVELAPDDYEKLKINRPKDIAVHAAVCDKRQTIHYLSKRDGKSGSAVDGIYEFMSESFRHAWWPGISLDTKSDQITEIECVPMNDILEQSPYTYYDFYSLDVEGAEFEVVQSIDFEKFSFGVILVEADGHNRRKNLALRTFVESKGYTFLMEDQRSYWFVNADFYNIYHELLH